MTTGLNHGYGGVNVNKKLNVKGFCTDLAYDLVGSVLYAAGIVCFVNPANMAPGGMSGVAILLNYLWGLPIGTMTIVLNIPLLILSYIFLGKSLTWKTVKSLVISSLMVDLVMARYAPVYAGDRMIGGVFGGVLMGAGLAIIFLRGSTTGGTDIISFLVKKWYPHVPIVVSEKNDEIAAQIMDELERGVTLLKGQGAYTGTDRDVLMCAVRKQQFARVRAIIYEKDPNAFVIVSETSEVLGEGFKQVSGL